MKLVVMQQVDIPLKLYDKPANLFVAGFIGSPQMNLIEGVADNDKVRLGEYLLAVDDHTAKRTNGRVTVGVRPESWRIVGATDGGIPVEINIIEELGADASPMSPARLAAHRTTSSSA